MLADADIRHTSAFEGGFVGSHWWVASPGSSSKPQEDVKHVCESTNLPSRFNYYYFVAPGERRH